MYKQYFVYIASNKNNAVLYTGVTGDLVKRASQHKNKIGSTFTKKYNITKIVYYEEYDDANYAIKREKQSEGGLRKKKLELIRQNNHDFNDLNNQINK